MGSMCLGVSLLVTQSLFGVGQLPGDGPRGTPKYPALDANASALPADFEHAYVVLIGMNSYGSGRPDRFANLTGAVKDVTDLNQFFSNLPGRKGRTRLLIDKFVSRESICEALSPSAVGDTGMIFVAIAGHGAMAPDGTPYLGLSDSDPVRLEETALPFSELIAMIGNTEIKVGHRVLAMDACQSGNALLVGLEKQIEPGATGFEQFCTPISQWTQEIDFVLSSYNASKESPFGGYFLQALLRGFRGYATPTAKIGSRKAISLFDAYSYAMSEVDLRANGQRPIQGGSDLGFGLLPVDDFCENALEKIIKIKKGPGPTSRTWEDIEFEVEFVDKEFEAVVKPTLELVWGTYKRDLRRVAMTYCPKSRSYTFIIKGGSIDSGKLTYYFQLRNKLDLDLSECKRTCQIKPP